MACSTTSKLVAALAALAGASLCAVACSGSNSTVDPVAGVGDDAGAGDASGDASAAAPDVRSGPCAPWDVQGDAQCQSPPFSQFAWFGGACARFPCFTCTGVDCGRRYLTAAGCDAALQACYNISGVTRACTADADCAVTPRTCCPCGNVGADDFIGVRTGEVDALHTAVCRGVGGCSECAMTVDPLVHAVCMSGRCLATR